MDLRRHITAGRLSEMVGAGRRGDRQGDPHHGLAPGRRGRAAAPGPRRPGSTSRPTPTGSTPTSTRSARRRGWRCEYVVLGQQVPGLPGRAVDAGGLPGLAQGDGLGPARQLRRRARPGPPRRDDEPSSGWPSCSRPTRTTRTSRSCRREDWQPAAGAGRPPRRRRPPCRTTCASEGRPRGLRGGRPRALDAVPVMLGRGRRHRLQLLGGLRQPDHHGQAAAGQRPAPRRRHPRHLVPDRACTAARSARSARSTSRGSPSPALPGVVIGHNAAGRLGLHQPRPGRHRLLPGAGPRRPATERDGALRAAARRRTETIHVRRRQGRARSPSGRPCTARSCPTSCPTSPRAGDTAPVDGQARRRRVRRVAGLDRRCTPGRTADAIFAARHGATTSPQFQAAARDFAVPAQNLVYADVDGQHRLPGAGPDPRPGLRHDGAAGPAAPGWKSRYDWTATCRSTSCPRRTTRRRASSSRPTRR